MAGETLPKGASASSTCADRLHCVRTETGVSVDASQRLRLLGSRQDTRCAVLGPCRAAHPAHHQHRAISDCKNRRLEKQRRSYHPSRQQRICAKKQKLKKSPNNFLKVFLAQIFEYKHHPLLPTLFSFKLRVGGGGSGSPLGGMVFVL